MPDDDLRRIVPTLFHGGEASRTLAGRIASGLDRRVALLALNADSEAPSWLAVESARAPASTPNDGSSTDPMNRLIPPACVQQTATR